MFDSSDPVEISEKGQRILKLIRTTPFSGPSRKRASEHLMESNQALLAGFSTIEVLSIGEGPFQHIEMLINYA